MIAYLAVFSLEQAVGSSYLLNEIFGLTKENSRIYAKIWRLILTIIVIGVASTNWEILAGIKTFNIFDLLLGSSKINIICVMTTADRPKIQITRIGSIGHCLPCYAIMIIYWWRQCSRQLSYYMLCSLILLRKVLPHIISTHNFTQATMVKQKRYIYGADFSPLT